MLKIPSERLRPEGFSALYTSLSQPVKSPGTALPLLTSRPWSLHSWE